MGFVDDYAARAGARAGALESKDWIPDEEEQKARSTEAWTDSASAKKLWEDQVESAGSANAFTMDWKGQRAWGADLNISRSDLEAMLARQRKAAFDEVKRNKDAEDLIRQRRRDGRKGQTKNDPMCKSLLKEFARSFRNKARKKMNECELISSTRDISLQLREKKPVAVSDDVKGEDEDEDADEDDGENDTDDDEPQSEGEKRWEKFGQVIDQLFTIADKKREAGQMQFIEAFKKAVPHLVYGESDWELGKARFFRRHGLAKLQKLVCCVAPRRFGKTVAVAIFTLALVLVVKRLPIIIFATNKRTATTIVQMQNTWLSAFPGGEDRKCRALSYIKLVPEDAQCRTDAQRQVHPDASGIWPMPASKNGTRGVTARVVIMEEAAYIDPMIWQMICMPLMGVKGSVLLGISTPSGQDNFYAGIISRKDKDGGDLFALVLIGMSCEDCRARGIGAHCAHMKHMLPAWKDPDGQKLLMDVMDENAFRQEAQGEQLSDKQPCFRPYEVAALWRRKRKRITGDNGVIFIGVDPCGGSGGAIAGRGSEVAMVALVYDEQDNIVVCTTASPSTPRKHTNTPTRALRTVLS